MRDLLLRLAAGRRSRMSSGRPRFDLAPEEIEASTDTAMRLAGYGVQGGTAGQVKAKVQEIVAGAVMDGLVDEAEVAQYILGLEDQRDELRQALHDAHGHLIHGRRTEAILAIEAVHDPDAFRREGRP